MKVKSESEVTQSSPTLGDLMDCSLPGSSIHGIFQARVLEWGAIAIDGINCDLEERTLFWIIWLGPQFPHMYPFRREAERDRHAEKVM